MAKQKHYEAVTSISAEGAAARVFEVMANQFGKVFTLDQLEDWTNLRRSQVVNGERYLKKYLAEHADEAVGWTLFIGLSGRSEHGLISDDDVTLGDQVARLRYQSTRAASELDYREQAILRVKDPITKKLLKNGITYQRAAAAGFSDAYDRIKNGLS